MTTVHNMVEQEASEGERRSPLQAASEIDHRRKSVASLVLLLDSKYLMSSN